jgi:hypothetical protein
MNLLRAFMSFQSRLDSLQTLPNSIYSSIANLSSIFFQESFNCLLGRLPASEPEKFGPDKPERPAADQPQLAAFRAGLSHR